MEKRYCFNKNESENIIKRFGENFHQKVLKDIQVYEDRWSLTSFQLIHSYSANVIFICNSEKFGNAVLKIGNPLSKEVFTEFNTLCEYDGKRFCRVFDADIENGVILEQRVQPGQPLRQECSVDKRVAVFCSLYRGLHRSPVSAEIYPTYIEWVNRITEYMSSRQDCKELYLYMKKAKDICLSVSNLYSRKMLLHGDLHHDNILLGDNGEYIIIDPKGVIGDPVFDIARFILNEFCDEITTQLYKKINDIIAILEKDLNIPRAILKQCLYVETAMAVCWDIEDGAAPDQYPKLLNDVAFAEKILNT